MSRVFLNHNYRLFMARQVGAVQPVHSGTQSDHSSDLISALCSESPDLEALRGRIANAVALGEALDLDDVIERLQLKTKTSHVRYTDPSSGDTVAYRIGHLRFQLSGVLPIQIFIFIESGSQPGLVTVLCKTLPKLLAVVGEYIVNDLGCLFDQLPLPDAFLRAAADSSVRIQHTDVELVFGVPSQVDADGKLSSLVLNVSPNDLSKLEGNGAGNSFMAGLTKYIDSQTAISLDKLALTRVRTELFLLGADGRVRFSDQMSFRPDPLRAGDRRPTIWRLLQAICDL